MESSRFEKQIRFIKEIDKLKRISRQTILMDGSRQENSAEHSWHVAIMAIVLSEYAQNAAIDWLRVLKMLLIHDLVEIDAGDTFCYSAQKCEDKELREQKAADRIFNLLPKDQEKNFALYGMNSKLKLLRNRFLRLRSTGCSLSCTTTITTVKPGRKIM